MDIANQEGAWDAPYIAKAETLDSKKKPKAELKLWTPEFQLLIRIPTITELFTAKKNSDKPSFFSLPWDRSVLLNKVVA